MIISVHQGDAHVTWNDSGDDTGQYPILIDLGGLHYEFKSDQPLHDLHECLNFLFNKPS